ncbi:MAG: cellulose biosynthesis cyclic di-GMP-binding regulatory protein BcsB [Rhodospirillales bacterium]
MGTDRLQNIRAALAGGLAALALAGAAAAQAPVRTAPAAPAAPSVPSPAASAPAVPLERFMPAPHPIVLRGLYAEQSLFFPVSPRTPTAAALLKLDLTNSIALQGDRSQLVVKLDNRVVAQLPLRGTQPSVAAEIDLPPALIRPGFNRLTFAAAQHVLPQCEDPNAPELWTQIDTARSTLALAPQAGPVRYRLGDLGALVGPGSASPYRVNVMTAGAGIDDARLRAGALVAQGLALRLGYVPLVARHLPLQAAAAAGPGVFGRLDQSPLVDGDAVLIGTKAEIAPFIADEIAAAINAAYLGIFPLERDPARFGLIVSGTTAAEVDRAATALTLMDFPFADAAQMRVDSVDRTTVATFGNAPTVEADSKHAFGDLGYRTRTIRGKADNEILIRFYLADQLYFPEEAMIELELDFAYGAGFGRVSALNLSLNGRFQATIALNDPNGAVLRDYRVTVVARELQAGMNTLRFEPVMSSVQAGNCEFAQFDNLLFSLADTSTMKVPPASRYARQPDLQLFSRTGFPYGRALGAEAALVAGATDPDTVAAYWSVAAKLAQVRRIALLDATYTAERGRGGGGHRLVVGAAGNLDPELFNAAALVIGNVHRVPYPSLRPRVEVPVGTNPAGEGGARGGRIAQANDLGENRYAMAFESPRGSGRTSTVVLAATPRLLRDGVDRMVLPDYWDQLRGDVFVWRDDPARIATTDAARTYGIGRLDPVDFGRYFVSSYPWVWIAAVVAIVLILAWLTRLWLRRYSRQHHGTAD